MGLVNLKCCRNASYSIEVHLRLRTADENGKGC